MPRPCKSFERVSDARKAAKVREHKLFKVTYATKNRETGKAQKKISYYVDPKGAPGYMKKNKAFSVEEI